MAESQESQSWAITGLCVLLAALALVVAWVGWDLRQAEKRVLTLERAVGLEPPAEPPK